MWINFNRCRSKTMYNYASFKLWVHHIVNLQSVITSSCTSVVLPDWALVAVIFHTCTQNSMLQIKGFLMAKLWWAFFGIFLIDRESFELQKHFCKCHNCRICNSKILRHMLPWEPTALCYFPLFRHYVYLAWANQTFACQQSVYFL